MLPLFSAMSCNCRFHVDGSVDCFNLSVQLLRLSFRRSRSTDGFTRLIDGITILRASSGRISTWKSISSSVAKYFCFVQSGLATVIFSAEKRGHGTHPRQPVSFGGRCQPTFRSPVI